MEGSDGFEHDDTLRGLEKAQKTLEDVQSRIKRFKSRKREQSQSSIAKAPFPDLSKYFSHLTNEFSHDEPEELLIPVDPRNKIPSKEAYPPSTLMGRVSESEKENYSMSINEKVQREKNSSINKIEQYYMQRNEVLEQKIRELKTIKEKIIKDQKLLLRNNQELEDQLHRQRSIDYQQQSSKCDQLRSKIDKMKEKITAVQGENARIAARKKDLQKHIKQVVKLHKEGLAHEVLTRPKSTSAVRCNYH